MVGRDAPQIVVGRIGTRTFEKHANLPLPTLEICAQDRRALVLVDFHRGELLHVDLKEADLRRGHADYEPSVCPRGATR
jgi:hypothetical protein